MIYVKSTKPGARAYDLGETGDPFLPEGERLHDRPDAAEVHSDMEAMSHKFDHLGSGAYDARHEAERAMRDSTLFGPTDGDPMQHGHTMAIRMEDYVKYAPGSERTAITEHAQEQERWKDAMWNEYQSRYPELAADPAATAAAIEYAMADLRWHGENAATWAQDNYDQFLKNVASYQSAGYGRESASDSGRTSGIGAGSNTPGARDAEADRVTDHEFMQELQRRKGIY